MRLSDLRGVRIHTMVIVATIAAAIAAAAAAIAPVISYRCFCWVL